MVPLILRLSNAQLRRACPVSSLAQITAICVASQTLVRFRFERLPRCKSLCLVLFLTSI